MINLPINNLEMSKRMRVCKVLIVRNFHLMPDLEIRIGDQLNSLESGIVAILNSKKADASLQELYNIVENIYNTHRHVLYEKLEWVLMETVTSKLNILLNNFENLLTFIDCMWREFCQQTDIVKNIFLKCDCCSKNKTSQLIAIQLFKSVIVSNPTIKNGLTFQILQHIYEERRQGIKYTALLKSIVSMLTELQMHIEVFQIDFLKSSNIFFQDEANHLINVLDIRAYLKHTKARIQNEKERSKYYLNTNCLNALLELIYHNMIKNHLQEILEKSFKLFSNSKLDSELRLVYNLVSKVPTGMKSLSEYFTDYILIKGDAIVRRQDNEKTMIQELLDFKDKLDDIVQTCFNGNHRFYEVIRNTFTKFINSKQSKPAQLLAKYIDGKLRSKDITEDELETILNKAIVVFRYIQGKDIFEAFYKKSLAKRLLLGKSTSQDAEDSMISKLKSECGPAFTSKIEGMFKDITVSQGINTAFKQYLNHNIMTRSKFDLCINVLTSSFWPNYPNFEVNLPVELLEYQQTFQKFYLMNHSGRKLVWQPNLGHCLVKARFESGYKELVLSLFQTIVLLLFNEYDEFSFSDMLEVTNIEHEELKRTLISLISKKSRILIKQSKEAELQDGDVFIFNKQFNDKLFRVKINQLQLKESIEEQMATEKSVITDRQFQIDAAIVRILKSKKKIHHSELISELFSALDIPVKPYDLKKRIELLIEREYLERDKDDPSNYIYIA